MQQHQPFYIQALPKEASTRPKYHCCLVWSSHMVEFYKFVSWRSKSWSKSWL